MPETQTAALTLEKAAEVLRDTDLYLRMLLTYREPIRNPRTDLNGLNLAKEEDIAFHEVSLLSEVINQALLGQLLSQRAEALSRSEARDFVKFAQRYNMGDQDWAALEINFPIEVLHLGIELNLYLFFLMALNYLQQRGSVNYGMISNPYKKILTLDSKLENDVTTWAQTSSEQGEIFQRLSWLEKTILEVAEVPHQAMIRQPNQVLQAGHFFAALRFITRPFFSLEVPELAHQLPIAHQFLSGAKP